MFIMVVAKCMIKKLCADRCYPCSFAAALIGLGEDLHQHLDRLVGGWPPMRLMLVRKHM